MTAHAPKVVPANTSPVGAGGDTFELRSILNSVLQTARGLVPADGFAVWSLDSSQTQWKIVASEGLSADFISQSTPGTSDAMPATVICAENVQNASILRDRLELYQREGIRSLMAAPIFIQEQRRGTLVFYFRTPHHFSQLEVELATSLASLSSSALAATELYREQLAARVRSDFLAEASAVLASSLNYEETLTRVAELSVPLIADGSAIDLLEGGELKRVAVVHPDQRQVERIWEISRRYPVVLSNDRALGRIVASGTSELFREMDDESLRRNARSAEHLELLRSLRIGSLLLVPLIHRQQVLGVITLATMQGGRILGEQEVSLAEALAGRAAVAIENARLFSALHQSERNFRAVSETASCAIFIHDGQQVLYANKAAQDVIGMRTGESREMWERIHPADRDVVMQRAKARLEGESVPTRYEFRIVRPDGAIVWLDLSASAIEYAGRKAVLATAFDVTERRLAVERLKQREQEARTLVNSLPDTISRFDRNLRYLYISPNIEQVAGRTAESCISHSFEELGFPQHLCTQWNDSLRRIFNGGQPENIEFSLPAPDGSIRHYIGTGVPEVKRDGVVESVMTISRDITEQRAVLEDLSRSRTQLRLIIDAIPGLVAYVDREERFRRVNRTFEQWFLVPLKTVLGKTVREVLGEQNYPNVEPRIREVLAGSEVQFEATNQYADAIRHVLVSYVPDLDDAGEVRGFVALIMDVTERRHAEDALRRTEKLAAAGRLAASIAHEINNPLESVTNLLYLLHQETQLSPMGREYLSLAEQELLRVSQIATQTLRFHRQSTRPSLTRVEEVLDAVQALYSSRVLRLGATLQKRYDDCPPIMAFEGELRQLFANLIANALDAIPLHGRLVVRTHAERDQNGRSGVRVTVADNGQGIPPDLLQHIFEPFVTSKGMTGTGLGLWVSKEIVQKHHGWMRVRSRTGAASGTVFQVFLADAAPVTQELRAAG